LALLGDVGIAYTETLRYFLHQQAARFRHVLYIAGNHEFYNICGTNNHRPKGRGDHHNVYTIDEQLAWLRGVCDERPNLHFMERQRLEIGNHAVILATTLWSYIPVRVVEQAERSMNDYRLCFTMDQHRGEEGHRRVVKRMDAAFTNAWHMESAQWLDHEIVRAARGGWSVYVLTHHTPALIGTSHPQYQESPLTHCFSTDLTRLLQHPVHVWACGHTHYNFNGKFQNKTNKTTMDQNNTATLLLSNQRGYPNKVSAGYDKYGVIVQIHSPKSQQS
jgi:hypothetical protein